jgi:hypothetical protein
MVENINKNKPTQQKIGKATMISVLGDDILLSSRSFNAYKSLAEKVFNDAMKFSNVREGVWELVESLDPVTDDTSESNRNRNVLVVSEHVSCLIVGYIYICMYIYIRTYI